MRPVLFNLTEAKRLVKHYDFLKTYKFNVGNYQYPIDLILIAPYDQMRFQKFLSVYNIYRDNDIALSNSGFDSNQLQVVLLEDDFISGMYAELDSYLTKNKIAKVYDVDLRFE